MAKADVINIQGEKVGEVELNDADLGHRRQALSDS